MKKSLAYISFATLLFGCSKVLDKKDLSGIPQEDVWNNESTATLFLNRIYDVIMPSWPANAGTATLPYALHQTSDESSTNGSTAILFGTLAQDGVTDMGASITSSTAPYYNIRKCNILLTQIDQGSLSQEVRTRLKSQAYFLRAWNYFNLVKLYGGVPYITTPQDWILDDVYTPRNTTSQCIDSLVRDLDSAALAPKEVTGAIAASSGNKGRINRGAALALKGRILLYFASPQFNPANSTSKWEAAYKANRAAYDSLIKDGYALHTNFANVLTDESTGNKEVILIRSYDGTTTQSNRANSFENAARPSSEGSGGGYQPTWDLVKAFPMKNGLAITETGSGYDPVYFWKNRDPRFDATIVYNGSLWPLSNQPTRKQWTYTGTPNNPENTPSTTGFYCRKGVNTGTLAANASMGTTDWVEIRLAEVMLNLAECANATGRMAEAYDMMTKIRARAGITAGTGSLYGLKAGMTQTEMFNAIIAERRIEFAFENKRYDDLRRNKLWATLNGTFRKKLTITVKSPYTTTILNNFIPGSTTVRVRDTINIDGPSYTNFFTVVEANIDAATSPIKFQDNYYYYAIPNAHISRNANLKQTNGWTGGTFDPLQ